MAALPSIRPPWVEGEKIPDERIREIYQPPPGIPATFYRSSLVIGSRGVGKTTLFRHQKATHAGLAVHISLATEFASLTKETGLGMLSVEFSSSLHRLIVGKAIALLAASIVDRLARKDIVADRTLLTDCLPSEIHPSASEMSVDGFAQLKTAVASTPLKAFERIAERQALPVLVGSLGEASARRRGPLLLLLDRADMIIAPSLVPALELLDQSSQYVALVAMRPGHAGQALSLLGDAAVAGDHYGVVHLGIEPRSQEWINFVENAVYAQLGSKFSSMPKRIKSQIMALSRDSLRTALELSARYLSATSRPGAVELVAALDDLRENQLAAAQRTLQRYHPDFRELIRRVRGEIVKKHGRISGPVLLQIDQQSADSLFSPTTPLTRFVEAGLRCGALCMRAGDRWVPGLHPRDLEVPPLLLWQKDDQSWVPNTAAPLVLGWGESEVFKRSGGPPRTPSIFVAYRMESEESKRFRKDLQAAIEMHPELGRFRVTDGHVPAGAEWPTKIRERIKDAKVVIGDVTGMRSDVLFELGFAYGLGRVRIPTVSKDAHATDVPQWLGATQLGQFGDDVRIMHLLSSLLTHLSDPEFAATSKAPQAIPTLAVWLRSLGWNAHAFDQLKTLMDREALTLEVLDETVADERLIRRAASASLLVASVDGTSADALIHYVCGAVAAKPKSGYGKVLQRRVLVLEEPSQRGRLVANSLKRCQDCVRVIQAERLIAEVTKFIEGYRDWLKEGKR